MWSRNCFKLFSNPFCFSIRSISARISDLKIIWRTIEPICRRSFSKLRHRIKNPWTLDSKYILNMWRKISDSPRIKFLSIRIDSAQGCLSKNQTRIPAQIFWITIFYPKNRIQMLFIIFRHNFSMPKTLQRKSEVKIPNHLGERPATNSFSSFVDSVT